MPQKASPQAQQQAQHEPQSPGAQPGMEQLAHPMGEKGPRLGFMTPPPPGKNGSCMTRDPKYGRSPGVYPVHAMGTFVDDPANPLTAGDAINLCYIPYGCILTNFIIVTSGVSGVLEDTLATPTQYGNVAGAVFTMAQVTGAALQNLGTMYATTPRPIGPEGPAVVQWQKGMTLHLANVAGTPATPMIYVVQWSPIYDSGVS